jgi:hypothetical protein
MKTNIIMKSEDRKIFGAIVRQETKTGFLNLSDLENIYQKQGIIEGWSAKRINELMQQKENSERIFYILKEQGLINYVELRELYENIENHGGITKYLKKIGVYKTTGARHTKTTWCNPYLWILIALELHPILYAKAVIWLTDKLVINRIEAGNMYRGLTSAVNKFKNVDWIKLAKALNYIVFNKHEAGIRNFANQKELKELEQLERQMAFSIDFGYIKTFDQLILDLRKIWNDKWVNNKYSLPETNQSGIIKK